MSRIPMTVLYCIPEDTVNRRAGTPFWLYFRKELVIVGQWLKAVACLQLRCCFLTSEANG